MINIIKPGEIIFIQECKTCGCIFSYNTGDLDDTLFRTQQSHAIRCPHCSKLCLHENSKVMKKEKESNDQW